MCLRTKSTCSPVPGTMVHVVRGALPLCVLFSNRRRPVSLTDPETRQTPRTPHLERGRGQAGAAIAAAHTGAPHKARRGSRGDSGRGGRHAARAASQRGVAYPAETRPRPRRDGAHGGGCLRRRQLATGGEPSRRSIDRDRAPVAVACKTILPVPCLVGSWACSLDGCRSFDEVVAFK